MKIAYALLMLIFFKVILLYKIYNSVPVLELKRLAKQKNQRAASLYKVAGYQAALDAFLWILGTISGAILLVWSARTSVWLASAIFIAAAYLIIWAPAPRWDGWAGGIAALSAKYLAAILSFLNPVLGRLSSWLPPAGRVHFHTGLYEKTDLLELLNKQNKQLDNRIDETDLRIASGAITFGDKTVGSVMTPRRKIRFVNADETVGPMLMDELHKTGHSRFPVTKDSAKAAAPAIVGTLYLKDIIGYQGGGKVKEHMRKEVYYINEDSNLRQALNEFIATRHHLLVVVNNFEEIAGVLSIEDVFEQIIGQPINDEFDSFDSLRAVAAKEAQAEQKQHQTAMPEVPADPALAPEK
jgi:CBS domain containing-hemolysin-like protein